MTASGADGCRRSKGKKNSDLSMSGWWRNVTEVEDKPSDGG